MKRRTPLTAENLGTAVSFGQLLRKKRMREHLSQRTLGHVLGVASSTIARLEAGTRRPPREVSFYDRMRQVPGWTDSDIRELRRTDDAPPWLIADEADDGAQRHRPAKVTARFDGVTVDVRFRPEDEGITGEEVAMLKAAVKADVEATIRDWRRRKDDRAKQLE